VTYLRGGTAANYSVSVDFASSRRVFIRLIILSPFARSFEVDHVDLSDTLFVDGFIEHVSLLGRLPAFALSESRRSLSPGALLATSSVMDLFPGMFHVLRPVSCQQDRAPEIGRGDFAIADLGGRQSASKFGEAGFARGRMPLVFVSRVGEAGGMMALRCRAPEAVIA